MMLFFAIVGMGVSMAVAVVLVSFGWRIVGNIYGGFIGAYRLHRAARGKRTRLSLGDALLQGLRCWHGCRYNGSNGVYVRVGGMKVPLDGRDPIRREYYG